MKNMEQNIEKKLAAYWNRYNIILYLFSPGEVKQNN